MDERAAVEFRNISVRFPGVLANDSVSLTVKRGEIFALVGENGAGKTTLMKVLYGMNRPTQGEVFVFGSRLEKYDPAYSISLGVGMVHQHFMLVPSFTVAQNIVLGREPKKSGVFYDKRAAERITHELIKAYGLEVDANAVVADLSVGAQQRVEILKTLYRGADILVLDEPTAVLTPNETKEFFDVLRGIVSEKGVTVIIITHKLNEVMEISDRVGVMRAGKLVGVCNTNEVTSQQLASMMVGREVLLDAVERSTTVGEPRVVIKDLNVYDDRGLHVVKGLSLSVRAGEILGVAGVEGNGQSELAEAITGLRKIASGVVSINGVSVSGLGPGEIRALGVSHVPEDRLRTGVSAPASVADNLLAGKQRDNRFARARIHRRSASISRYVDEVKTQFDIRAAGSDVAAGSLSGGNIQKLVVAREFSFEHANVLVICQPTRGVDIGAMEYIHSLILAKRSDGCAILLISADLDELFRISDRIVTMYEGELTGEFVTGETNHYEVGAYMAGAIGGVNHDV
ncbi:MAG: ABC transporter ATP-binding protein [Clostridia bacterium]|nr:ABC transporter ATP-binding protein [Clostridia bacterium]